MKPSKNTQNTSVQKSSLKIWLVIAIIILLQCLLYACLVAAGGSGLYLLDRNGRKKEINWENKNVLSTPPLQPEGEVFFKSSFAEVSGSLENKGYAEIPIKVNAQHDIHIIESGAFLTPDDELPGKSQLNVFMLVERTPAVVGFDIFFIMKSAYATGLEEETYGTLHGLDVIPENQAGPVFFNIGYIDNNLVPTQIHLTLRSPNYSTDGYFLAQKLTEMTSFEPFFIPVSTGFTAKQLSTGFYQVDVKGQYTNNLPVNAAADGLFLLYDEQGKMINFTTSYILDYSPEIIAPQETGEIRVRMPYTLGVKPASVWFYPFIDFDTLSGLSYAPGERGAIIENQPALN
jgi:hypothetical protein